MTRFAFVLAPLVLVLSPAGAQNAAPPAPPTTAMERVATQLGSFYIQSQQQQDNVMLLQQQIARLQAELDKAHKRVEELEKATP